MGYVLVVDEAGRPLGWAAADDLTGSDRVTAEMANPVSPLVNKRTTLKDALSMMLDADVQTGIVVDRAGTVQGLVTIETIARKMREGEHSPAFDDLALLATDDDDSVDGGVPVRPDAGAADQAAIESGV
jgi:CBS domain containing-hemolysin-like protein